MPSDDCSAPPPRTDLDALIGDLRLEAARRRAEPAFPVDHEARLGVELDHRAPQPQASRLDRLADAASRAVATDIADSAGSGTRSRAGSRTVAGRVARRVLSADLGPIGEHLSSLGERVSSLGTVLAAALGVMSGRFSDLEDRLHALEHPGGHPASEASAVRDSAVPDGWEAWLRSGIPTPRGRVLYYGADAETPVAALRHDGLDAYGLDPLTDRYLVHPDVRPGGILEHLRAVGDGALGAVILVGLVVGPDGSLVRELAAQVSRVSTTAIVISQAPWWWRETVGPEQADLAPVRPLSAETWLAAWHGVGFTGTAQYDEGGASYRIVAGRPQ